MLIWLLCIESTKSSSFMILLSSDVVHTLSLYYIPVLMIPFIIAGETTNQFQKPTRCNKKKLNLSFKQHAIIVIIVYSTLNYYYL